jgi:hypothetical protein
MVKVGTPGIRVSFPAYVSDKYYTDFSSFHKENIAFRWFDKPVNQGQHIVLVVCFFNVFQPKK